MTMYQVTVSTLTEYTDNDNIVWSGPIHAPTFYLDSNVQGIINADHAAKIVREWLNSTGLLVDAITVLTEGDYRMGIGNDPTHPSWDAKY